jgi:hypothetical protein
MQTPEEKFSYPTRPLGVKGGIVEEYPFKAKALMDAV